MKSKRETSKATGKEKTPTELKTPRKPLWSYLIFLVVVTSLVYSGVSKLKWTNWDDDVYVYENPLVKNGELSRVFTEPTANTYNPLVVASWAMEWKMAGDAPLLYHVDNLLLHLMCVVLVFLLLIQLSIEPLWATAGALLFAVHPMRVESVAWITERKDVLYALFYLLALFHYLRFLDNGKKIPLVLSFVFFVVSLLCKIQAVTLAPTLLLIDWYKGRKFTLKSLLEKLPFFAAAVVVGLLGIHFLKQGHVIDLQGEEHSFIDRLVLGFYAYAMYLFKLILPYITCTYYPQPVSPKWYHYLISISGVLLIALTAINYKKNKQWTFAIAYFTIHIILLLQIVAAGSAFLADRFTYVASLGVVFISMYWVQHTIGNRPGLRLVFIALLLLFTVGYAVASVNYIKAWKDSDTIWSDVIEKYPRKVVVAYVNRGHYLRRQGQNDRAFADFNTAIELKKDYFLGYLNRGNIYFDRQENEKAMQDYMKCVQLKPNLDTTGVNRDAEAGNIYGNLGVIYGRLQLYDSSLYYLNIAIKSDPTKLNYYKNRALVYCEMRRYAESNTDFNKALEINPVDADIINAIGVNYLRAGENPKAKEQFDLAIQQNANSALFYLNRAFALQGMNKQQEALRDAIKAKELGLQVDPQFLNELGGNAGSR